jgi:hypothetical protein
MAHGTGHSVISRHVTIVRKDLLVTSLNQDEAVWERLGQKGGSGQLADRVERSAVKNSGRLVSQSGLQFRMRPVRTCETPRLSRRLALLLTFACLTQSFWSSTSWGKEPSSEPEALKPEVLCSELEAQATARTLPPDFFVRLIWKESRFNPQAVSPKGAEGIAQFMPGTAADRGLVDAFDPMAAIAESASYLADLATEFGNVGLAAAAYNAGPSRVRNWLAGTVNLPGETIDYVRYTTGRPVDDWKVVDTALPSLLEEGKSLQGWCRALPTTRHVYHPTSEGQPSAGPTRPWGVQLTAHFNRTTALATFSRLKTQYTSVLGDPEPIVVRDRNPAFGRKARYAVQIGLNSSAEAKKLCDRLRARGGACGVKKN